MFLNRRDSLGKLIFTSLRSDVVFVSCVFVSLSLGGWLIDLKSSEGVVSVELSSVLAELPPHSTLFLGSENWRVFQKCFCFFSLSGHLIYVMEDRICFSVSSTSSISDMSSSMTGMIRCFFFSISCSATWYSYRVHSLLRKRGDRIRMVLRLLLMASMMFSNIAGNQ